MDFSIPDTHHDVQALCNRVLKDFSTQERLREMDSQSQAWDHALWQQFVDSGLHLISLPESIGGSALDLHAAAAVAQSIGEHTAHTPWLYCIAIAHGLSSFEQQDAVSDLLNALTQGRVICTPAMIELGNDVLEAPATRAEHNDNSWQLNGNKDCVPYAADAEQLLVTAACEHGLWLGLVRKDQAGVVEEDQLATHGEPQSHITFHNAHAACLAYGDDATHLVQQINNLLLALQCATAIGVAKAMLDLAAQYTGQRKQFGVAIATFQAVAHRLADCYIAIERLEILTLKAVDDVDQKHPGAMLSCAMAKALCGDVLHDVSQATQHVHGGMGIDRDYPLFRYCQWAKHLELHLGGTQHHLCRLADALEKQTLSDCTGS